MITTITNCFIPCKKPPLAIDKNVEEYTKEKANIARDVDFREPR